MLNILKHNPFLLWEKSERKGRKKSEDQEGYFETWLKVITEKIQRNYMATLTRLKQ